MAGAGAYGAGSGPAGFSPGPDSSAGAQSSLPAALLYDPATKDFRRNADGTFVSIDPVDQEVAIALSMAFGTIGSASSAGQKIARMKRIGGPGFQGIVLDYVNQALAALLSRNAISVIRTDIIIPKPGAMFVSVNYVNLTIASPSPVQTAQVPLI